VLFEFAILVSFAFVFDWLYRKVGAVIQGRFGPEFAGPFGFLQPWADFIKLLGKEEIVPRHAGTIFALVPYVVCVLPLVGIWTIMNRGNLVTIFLILALDSLLLWLVGYYSKSRFALIGSMRLVLLFFSYELPLMLSVMAVIITTGSYNLVPVGFSLPLAFLIMFVATFAKLEFPPFDAAMAEQEIVAGYLTEYSGARLALMRLGKKLDLVMMTYFTASLFMFNHDTTESFLLVAAISAISNLLPRYRIDQAVKRLWVMTPLALIQIMVVSLA